MWPIDTEGDLEGIRSGWGKSKSITFKERWSLVWLKNIQMAGVARAKILQSRVLELEVGEITRPKSWSALETVINDGVLGWREVTGGFGAVGSPSVKNWLEGARLEAGNCDVMIEVWMRNDGGVDRNESRGVVRSDQAWGVFWILTWFVVGRGNN